MLALQGVRLAGSSTPVGILCSDGMIERVRASRVEAPAGTEELECDGLLAMPAFVDVHSHADGRAWIPDISEPKRAQGIADEVVGNCGLGPAPAPAGETAWRSLVGGVCVGSPVEGPALPYRDYELSLAAANVGAWPRLHTLVPYGAIRASVAGMRRDLDAGARVAARRLIEDALAGESLGVSLGLVYPPNDAASFEEMTQVLQPLASARKVLATHIRSQANAWIEAVDEVLRLAAALNVRLLISHLCVGGRRHQWKVDWVLARLREARREGVDVWFDQHPYAAGSTSLTQLLPPWTMRSGDDGLELAVGPDDLASLLAEPSVHAGWENYIELVGADHVLLAGAPDDPELVGRTVADVQRQLDRSLAETLVELLRRTSGNAAIVLLELYDEATIERIAAEPFGCFSTDGIHSALPHPRLFGTYPYAFGRFVRTGVLDEGEFVERTSRRPAQILGLARSASLAPGEPADLVVVDPDRFDHRPDYLAPRAPVEGLTHLVLAGERWTSDARRHVR